MSKGKTVDATVADHILPVETHPQLAFDLNNTQSLCNSCNVKKGYKDRKEAKEMTGSKG